MWMQVGDDKYYNSDTFRSLVASGGPNIWGVVAHLESGSQVGVAGSFSTEQEAKDAVRDIARKSSRHWVMTNSGALNLDTLETLQVGGNGPYYVNSLGLFYPPSGFSTLQEAKDALKAIVEAVNVLDPVDVV